MPYLVRRAREEWLLVAEMVILGSFAAGDASGLLKTLSGKEVDARWVFLAAIPIIGITALIRLGQLRDDLAQYRATVRVTARLGSLSANIPDPGPDKVSLSVHVFWEVWVNQDVSTDRLGLNLIYVYDKRWWQFWRKTRFPQKGIPPKGQDTTQYRRRIYASESQPFKDDAIFEYVADRTGFEPHWELELVLVTGVPSASYRIPVFIDYDELRSRGTNPPL